MDADTIFTQLDQATTNLAADLATSTAPLVTANNGTATAAAVREPITHPIARIDFQPTTLIPRW